MTEPSSRNDPLKAAWLSQPVETTQMSVLALTTAATRFERKIRRRNLIEYVAGAFVFIAFGGLAIFGHQGWIVRSGEALGVAGVAFVLWQLHLRGRPGRAPEAGSPETLLAFQHAEFIRQRDALKTVPIWYLLPLVPGALVILLGRWLQDHNPRITLAEDHGRIVIGGVIMVLLLAIVWLLNALGAARLDREIDKIERLQRG